jgi:rod shape-determining protein MreB
MNGVPKEIVISERQILESLAEPVGLIVEAVGRGSNTPRPSSPPTRRQRHCFNWRRRVVGQSRLRIAARNRPPVSIADDPLSCVAPGTGRALKMKTLKTC